MLASISFIWRISAIFIKSLQYRIFSCVISKIYLCLVYFLFLAFIIAFLIDSKEKINDGNLKLQIKYSSFYFICSAKYTMVLIPFPDHARSQKSDIDDQEENQNHYHQEHFTPTMEDPVKENSKKPTQGQQQQDLLPCSICKSDKIITDLESGEIICSNCGMVISDKIQQINRQEWRT